MTAKPDFAAEILKRSAGGYAGAAAAQLLDREPGLRTQEGALEAWKSHLTQRVMELAAALRAGEPILFTARVAWSRKTFAARDQADTLVAESLACLRDVLDESLPDIAKSDCLACIDAAQQAIAEGPAVVVESELDPTDPDGRMALNYLQLALEGNGASAVRMIQEAIAAGKTAKEVYVRVLLPAQREIGRLWHLNEVSVAEEHLVTGTTHQAMAVLRHTAERAPDNGATVVAACVPGNIHDIGLRALADIFQLEGWRSIYLGADVPKSDLPAMLDVFEADLLLLGSTLSTHIEPAAQAIAIVRDQVDRPVKIMVGGAAFDEVPELWEKLGADAYAADADQALAAAAAMLKA
jgi:methanogenic corrinoid protein MtbC1